MSGHSALLAAVAEADDPKNHGNGYQLRVWLSDEHSYMGALVRLGVGVLILERASDNPNAPARRFFIDPDAVQVTEVVW